MTALNFPPQPQEIGNTYVGGNGVTYVWSGTIWSVAGNPGSTGNVTFAGNTIATASGGNVNISAGGFEWIFDENGNIMLPSYGTINFADGSDALVLNPATTSVLGGVKLGEGFVLNASNQVTTSKLYSTNLTQPTQHYRLELDTNGVVILPDQSIINGSTLRAVAGSYAGLTTNDGENSWMWVDSGGAYIATEYSTTANQWTFDNNGNLTLPAGGTINYSDGSNALVGGGGVTDLIANGSANLTISSDGTLVLSHPDEPVYHPLDTQLVIEKAAGNYHIISGAYGLSLQATPVLGGYGDLTNNNYVDIFHDGISINVNDNTWGFDLGGNLTLPLVTRMNSGGIGAVRSAEFGTVVNAEAPGVINTSNIYMSAGTGEARIMSDANGNTLTYFGVEDPGFAGFVSMDAGVTSQYAVGLDANSNIILGATQPSGTVTTTMYTASIGAINGDYNINGLYADSTSTVVSGLSNVKIQTGGGNVWQFDANGTTTFPNNTLKTYTNSNLTVQTQVVYNITTITNGGTGYGSQSGTSTSGGSGTGMTVNINQSGTVVDLVIVNNPGTGYQNGDTITILGGSGTATFTIANYSSTGSNGATTWTFGTDGNLTLPLGGTINWSNGSNALVGGGAVNTGNITFSDNTIGTSNAGNIVLSTNSKTWTFGADGIATIPGGSTIQDLGYGYGSGHGLWLNTAYNGNASALFQDSISNQIITQDYNNGHWAVINTQFTGGDSSHPEILLITNPGNGLPKNDWILGSDGTTYLPSNSVITSHNYDTGNVTTVGSNISIRTASDGPTFHDWTFGSNGNLTFPDATVQPTAYQRTTGTWNVTVGSNTYSFTVPGNDTYSMWVRGNVTNGIIVWNATATVTNTNVPVIGQQFAWNYTGGGTPLEITAIPTQFIGTAGAIVSSNPSVGTTSNVFDFVIYNNSGSPQTVYWGYVIQ